MSGVAIHTQLHRIQTFLAVVDFGSYTRAADHLGLSKAMASLHVKALEQALGVTLLTRSTRAIALTEGGQAFYQDFKAVVATIDNAFEQVMQRSNRIAGTLRISTTSEYGERFVLPLIPAFVAQYPELGISYQVNSSLNDLVAEKLDLVVRLGTLRDSGFRSRKLAEYAIVLVAAPALLAARGEDIDRLPWIANSNLAKPTQWTLRRHDGAAVHVSGRATFHANAASAIRAMAVAGLGVAVLPEWLVAQDMAEGTLQRLIPEYSLPHQPVSVVFPNSDPLPAKTRAFIDFLAARLAQ